MEQIELIQEFKASLKTAGRSKDTVEQYPQTVRVLYDFTGGDLLGVNEDTLTKYLDHLRNTKKLSQASITRYFAIFGTFFDFLVFKKYMEANPVTSAFKKYYLRSYKKQEASRRRCPTTEEVKLLVHSILTPREQAPVVLLFKTGVRCHECCELDISDVDFDNLTLHVHPTGKRTNTEVYFDKETSRVLKRWLNRRADDNPALFLDSFGNRLSPTALERLFTRNAAACGLCDPSSKKLEDKLTPHCARHWFVTTLMGEEEDDDNGMKENFVKELRGDKSRDVISVYHHISKQKLKQSYLDHMPLLGL
ncbi:MAG: tyrosine-type recombinase/integrase [Methanotrichaceae archaeon]|jgi:integrase